jgi:hypothetical protein
VESSQLIFLLSLSSRKIQTTYLSCRRGLVGKSAFLSSRSWRHCPVRKPRPSFLRRDRVSKVKPPILMSQSSRKTQTIFLTPRPSQQSQTTYLDVAVKPENPNHFSYAVDKSAKPNHLSWRRALVCEVGCLFFCCRALASGVKSSIFLLSRPSQRSQVVYFSVVAP